MPTKPVAVDGRTWQARHLARMRRELTEHCGGAPSAPQRALIDRAAQLSLQVTIMDRRTAKGWSMSEHDSRVYLAWSNSLQRCLALIGNEKPAQAKQPTIAEFLAAHASAAA